MPMKIFGLRVSINIVVYSILSVGCLLQSCTTSEGPGKPVTGNESGSNPVNESEVNEYKRAVHKCYKSGGNRVVKIAGKLRCFN